MEPGVMLSAIREYSVKEQRIFMQNLSLEPANALSGKDLRLPRAANSATQVLLRLAVGERKADIRCCPVQGRRGRESNFLVSGEPAGIRTQDPRLKRALLYQLSYELTHFPG